jgi:teichuronic acid biosynthesis glycosyltransferase TuaC
MKETHPFTRSARGPRLLSLSTEFPNPSEPGKGLFVRARLCAIARRVPVTVVAPLALLDYANPNNEMFASLHVPTRRVDDGMEILHPRWLYPPKGGWLNAFFLFTRLVWPLARLKSRHTYDVIDAHFAHPEGIAAVLSGRILRMPVVITMRGSELRYRRHKGRMFWIGWALRRASSVITVSEGLRQLALELGVDAARTKVIPNGVDTRVFFRRDRQACRRAFDLSDSERIILCAGDLAELKGHHRVIRALTALRDSGIVARLIIVGGVGRSGRYAATLRQQVAEFNIRDRVQFAGEIKQERLAELMCAADVFCLASSSEGWPNVVNEALASGTPVVATDVGAVRQMITSQEYGLIVPVDDPEALADALRSALTREWDRDVISAWGRRRSWDDVAEEVLEQVSAAIAENTLRRAGR